MTPLPIRPKCALYNTWCTYDEHSRFLWPSDLSPNITITQKVALVPQKGQIALKCVMDYSCSPEHELHQFEQSTCFTIIPKPGFYILTLHLDLKHYLSSKKSKIICMFWILSHFIFRIMVKTLILRVFVNIKASQTLWSVADDTDADTWSLEWYWKHKTFSLYLDRFVIFQQTLLQHCTWSTGSKGNKDSYIWL